jgi:hypothetical protein
MKYILLSFLLLFIGCKDNNNQNNNTNDNINDNIKPITNGTWYKPTLNTTWQWQLLGNLNASYTVDMYDIDLYDTSKETITNLKLNGKKVICYFSAGSYENWREDKSEFPTEVLGNKLDGWENEQWLDISNNKFYNIMLSRLDLAVSKGCDGVEPDNMDGYLNNTGFSLNYQDQLNYNKFISNEARTRGLSVGLKNDLEQIKDLVDFFDFAVNEECYQYEECETLSIFIEANKPVFHVEYENKFINDHNSLCNYSNNHNFNTLILPLDLNDEFRISCQH